MILIIVAHPDDETLWFSGGIKYFLDSNIQFGIITLTNALNNLRSSEFFQFINMIGVPGFMLDLEDGGVVDWVYLDIEEKLIKLFKEQSIECTGIITHSPFGEERAHRQHINASKALRLFSAKFKIPFGFFSCHNLWTRKFANVKLFPRQLLMPLSFSLIKQGIKDCALFSVEVMVQLRHGRFFRKDFPVDKSFLESCVACYPSQFQPPYTYLWINSDFNLMYGDRNLIESFEMSGRK